MPEKQTEKHVLQPLIFPKIGLCTVDELYFRTRSPNVVYEYEKALLHFGHLGEVAFDTAFNAFSAAKWQENTSVANLAFELEGQGKFLLRLESMRGATDKQILAEIEVDLGDNKKTASLAVPTSALGNAIVYARVACLSEQGLVRGGRFTTTTAPERQVRLGVVITTYNRQKYVTANLGELQHLPKDDYHVVVVDNAENLNLPSSDRVTVLPNPNLGGAGGFSRGLFHLRELGGFTHALFMDDDVRFEIESIRRTRTFMQYARDAKLCVSGAMFVETQPHLQYEAGAAFHFRQVLPQITAFGHNLDMRRRLNVVRNETEPRAVGYAGWWFFGFPIDISGDDLAFPLFVRGDDLMFSYKYARKIVTLNGVLVWHLPFDHKDSATSIYYNQRNWELVRVCAGPSDIGLRPALQFFLRATLIDNFTYRYTTAAYRIQAMRDFMRGPALLNDMRFSEFNATLRKGDNEQPKQVNATSQAYVHRPSRLRKAAQLLTLNGHLLPGWLMKSAAGLRSLPLQHRAIAGVFRERKVLYLNEATNEGYVAEHSKQKFFRNLLDLATTGLLVAQHYEEVRHAYAEAYAGLVSADYWTKHFAVQAGEKPAPGKRERRMRLAVDG